MTDGPRRLWRTVARPAWPGVDRARLAALTRRTREVLLIAGMTGSVVGLVVAGFEELVGRVLYGEVRTLPLPAQLVLPAVGVGLSVLCLRIRGRHSASTTDEYIRSFHDQTGRLDLRAVPARLAASVVTLGSGAPLGYEGPSLYAGAAVGSAVQRRLNRYFTIEESKLLLVAGAAAGVSAIFKAPVTGLVFALEVPFQQDLARRMLLPAAMSSAASYVVFAAIAGTEPILPVAGEPPFNLVDLGGAAVIGLAAGVLARVFVTIVRHAKRLSSMGHPAVRVAAAGVVLAGTVLGGEALGDAPLALGPGYDALRWAMEPDRGLLAIVVLATLRVVGTGATLAGGGTGGLFIPLVIQGALLGRAIGGLFDPGNLTLFPVVGMAAFLGAGYRVPLAAVVFVAEFTGRPGFVVPGLIAAVVAQLVMGNASISPYQVSGRVGHLERRLRTPLRSLLSREGSTVPPGTRVDEVFWTHLVGTRQQAAPVVDDDGTYLGLVRVDDLAAIERSTWATTKVDEVMLTDVPVAAPDWTLGDAILAMERAGVDRLPVCRDGRFVGVVTATDLVQLDEIMDRGEPD